MRVFMPVRVWEFAMDANELEQIVARLRERGTDDDAVEVKKCAAKLSNDVWESVSAFANTHGGTIILGLEEQSGFAPVSSFAFEAVRGAFVSGIGDGGADNAALTNPPHYELHRLPFEGCQVLVIEIAELDVRLKPCFITRRGIANGSYKRVDDKDIRLSPTELYELQNILIPSTADREAVSEASLTDLDGAILDSLIAREQRRNAKSLRGVHTREEQLSRLNVTNGRGEVRLAGLLVAGIYPQQYFPKLVVDVAVHAGADKAEPGQPRFLDRVQCEGPLGEVVQEAVHAIIKNLRTVSVVQGTGRRDEPEIPEEVLREAIVNAVVHREYGPYFTGQSVSVDIFSDRVVIMNPGGLWGGKTLETIQDGSSRCRNETLMKLMSSVPLSDGSGIPAEGQGSGIALMVREMQSRALEPPHFEAELDCFKVVLGRGGVEVEENRSWIQGIAGDALDRHEEAVLVMARDKGVVTVHGIRSLLRIDSDDIRELCARLVDRGYLERVGVDEYRMVGADFRRGQPIDESILGILSREEPLGVREIALRIDRNLPTVRYHMKKLVDGGLVVATAPTNSPQRKYRLAR